MRRLIIIALLLIASAAHGSGEFALGPSGQERIVASSIIEPDADWSEATFNGTNCIETRFGSTVSWDSTISCLNQNAENMSFKGLWLTSMRLLVTTELAASSTGACEFRVTRNNGGVAISDALEVGPGSGNTMDVGTVYEVRFNERLVAGQTFEIEARDGDECGAGAACACGNLGIQQLSVWGRY